MVPIPSYAPPFLSPHDFVGCKPDLSEPSTKNISELNFDGGTKGNLRSTRVGGIFRDLLERSMYIYSRNFGISSNNTIELMGIYMGLEIT